MQVGPAPGQSTQQIRRRCTLAAQYIERRERSSRAVGLPEDVTLAWVLDRPGVVRTQETETLDGRDCVARRSPRCSVVRSTSWSRAAPPEGDALGAELRALHTALRTQVDAIAARTPAALARYQERLRERIAALLGETCPTGPDPDRGGAWADKTDVREEMTRLRAHLEQFTLLLDGRPVGRPLDFLIQELNREVNTNTVASRRTIWNSSPSPALAAKGIIEKMREQAQNLEPGWSAPWRSA